MIGLPIVMAFCFVISAMSGVVLAPIAGKLTLKPWFALNAAVATIILTGIFSGLFFSTNFIFSNPETAHTERAVIERKYSEKHYRTKRVSRNRYTRGEPYYEYYLEMRYPNGRIKPMLVNINRYRRVNPGDTLDVTLRRGLYGIAVIRN